jgi:Dynein heavy chain, N-terminal region 2
MYPATSDWYKTLWDKIDVDFLSEETKKLQKDVKQLNKAVRNYDVYRLMEEKLKAMGTSLPLVGDLAHPAMRDRHWEQLMKATGKTFVKDDKFSLGNLLELGLHNYVDDCSEIVDRAQKVCIRLSSTCMMTERLLCMLRHEPHVTTRLTEAVSVRSGAQHREAAGEDRDHLEPAESLILSVPGHRCLPDERG